MNLPIRFPSDAEVIAEEAARFRALTPAERMRCIRGLVEAGALLMNRSANSEFSHRHALEQENLAQRAVKEFLTRHGR